MIHSRYILLSIVLTIFLASGWVTTSEEWGFFGHRRINRLAVFTLDHDMMPFYRAHIEYLTDHAVDPDKRRYATKHEAVRHYIDLDHWKEEGVENYENVPRNWIDALIWKSELVIIDGTDSIRWKIDSISSQDINTRYSPNSRISLSDNQGRTLTVSLTDFRELFSEKVMPKYYDDEIILSPEVLRTLGFPVKPGTQLIVEEKFSEYGIVPYHLESMCRRLTKAFKEEDIERILRLSAEVGHYIGDAHVPLHTTENYNGQMTGQTGIHAFWESRLPELFADEEYDYIVGKAEYIEDKQTYFWDVVLASHALVDSVLQTEMKLRQTFPEDQQLCYDERLGRMVKTQCPEFCRAWSDSMDGMVEARFRAAIKSIGSVWYTCWIDAGQPDLSKLAPKNISMKESKALDKAYKQGRIKGRPHE